MNFQFYCPQGHLLQSDTANAGCTIACPICGTQFIVPAPPQSILDAEKAQKEAAEEPEEESEESLFSFGSGFRSGKKRSGGTNLNDILGAQGDDDEDDEDSEDEDGDDDDEDDGNEESDEKDETEAPILSFDPTANDRGADLPPLHIPCPNGHVLEVPRDILGEDAECPECGEIFTLKREKSFEYVNERYKRETKAEAKASQEWFVRAMIGVGLAIGLLLLLFLS